MYTHSQEKIFATKDINSAIKHSYKRILNTILPKLSSFTFCLLQQTGAFSFSTHIILTMHNTLSLHLQNNARL